MHFLFAATAVPPPAMNRRANHAATAGSDRLAGVRPNHLRSAEVRSIEPVNGPRSNCRVLARGTLSSGRGASLHDIIRRPVAI